jgi:hypothetical protein
MEQKREKKGRETLGNDKKKRLKKREAEKERQIKREKIEE